MRCVKELIRRHLLLDGRDDHLGVAIASGVAVDRHARVGNVELIESLLVLEHVARIVIGEQATDQQKVEAL